MPQLINRVLTDNIQFDARVFTRLFNDCGGAGNDACHRRLVAACWPSEVQQGQNECLRVR